VIASPGAAARGVERARQLGGPKPSGKKSADWLCNLDFAYDDHFVPYDCAVNSYLEAGSLK
jgi:hypothetical protein